MKASIEFYGLWLLIIVFMLLGLNIATITHRINEANQFRNFLIFEIDNHHGYNETIARKIDNNKICNWCEAKVMKESNQYIVEVEGEMKTLFFDISIPIHLKSFTNMIF